MKPVTLMTIAGSDSSASAGIQADLKTFSAIGLYGTSVITAITAQNSQGVISIEGVTPTMVTDQMKAILNRFPISAIKIGMLFSNEVIKAVISQLKDNFKAPIVIDPVLSSTTGQSLIKDQAIDLLLQELIPLCQLVTPNIPEITAMVEQPIHSLCDMKEACKKLYDSTQVPILLTGGHLPKSATDILFDGNNFHTFHGDKINTPNSRGTGCSLSAAIAAYLALGYHLIESIHKGKEFVTEAIRYSTTFEEGDGALNHFWQYHKE